MTIPNMPAQQPRAAAGLDPRGVLVWDGPLPDDDLQRQEDSTLVSDRDRARLFAPRGHTRPATSAEKQLLTHLGYVVGRQPRNRRLQRRAPRNRE